MIASFSFRGRAAVALIILLAGGLFWTPNQFKLAQQRRNSSQTLAQYTDILRQITNSTQELEACRREVSGQIQSRELARASAAQAERRPLPPGELVEALQDRVHEIIEKNCPECRGYGQVNLTEIGRPHWVQCAVCRPARARKVRDGE